MYVQKKFIIIHKNDSHVEYYREETESLGIMPYAAKVVLKLLLNFRVLFCFFFKRNREREGERERERERERETETETVRDRDRQTDRVRSQ